MCEACLKKSGIKEIPKNVISIANLRTFNFVSHLVTTYKMRNFHISVWTDPVKPGQILYTLEIKYVLIYFNAKVVKTKFICNNSQSILILSFLTLLWDLHILGHMSSILEHTLLLITMTRKSPTCSPQTETQPTLPLREQALSAWNLTLFSVWSSACLLQSAK